MKLEDVEFRNSGTPVSFGNHSLLHDYTQCIRKINLITNILSFLLACKIEVVTAEKYKVEKRKAVFKMGS